MYASIYDEVHYTLTPIYDGYSPQILVTTSSTAIRTDIALSDKHLLKVWGQLKNTHHLPLYKAMVKLVEVSGKDILQNPKEVAHSFTDASGFYFFDTCISIKKCYRLVVLSRNPLNHQIIVPAFSSCQKTTCNPSIPSRKEVTSL